MCRLLTVSKSGFYAQAGRGGSARARQDVVLTGKINAIYARSRGSYGSPRVHAQLRAEGLRVGRKRVERLMHAAGLKGARLLPCRGALRGRQSPRSFESVPGCDDLFGPALGHL